MYRIEIIVVAKVFDDVLIDDLLEQCRIKMGRERKMKINEAKFRNHSRLDDFAEYGFL